MRERVQVHVGGRREADVIDGHCPLGGSQLPTVGETRLLFLHPGGVNCGSARRSEWIIVGGFQADLQINGS